MIALRGDELDLDKKGKHWTNECTAIEIARETSKTEVESLLEKFTANPTQTKYEMCIEFGLVDADAAELFAMTVFLCDDFLRLKEPSTTASTESLPISRFFKIAAKLPMELQMVLCYHVFGSGKGNIKSKDSELAFRFLAQTFQD
jgi:hypothetical protein